MCIRDRCTTIKQGWKGIYPPLFPQLQTNQVRLRRAWNASATKINVTGNFFSTLHPPPSPPSNGLFFRTLSFIHVEVRSGVNCKFSYNLLANSTCATVESALVGMETNRGGNWANIISRRPMYTIDDGDVTIRDWKKAREGAQWYGGNCRTYLYRKVSIIYICLLFFASKNIKIKWNQVFWKYIGEGPMYLYVTAPLL